MQQSYVSIYFVPLYYVYALFCFHFPKYSIGIYMDYSIKTD